MDQTGWKKNKDFMNSRDLVCPGFVCLSYQKHIFFHLSILINYVLYKTIKNTCGDQGGGYFAI